MMGRKIRVRCPVCGMLVWQSRLNKDFSFEFVLQESSGRGYKKIEHKYKWMRVPDSEGAKLFVTMLAAKMVEKAKAMVRMVGADDFIGISLRMAGEDIADALDDIDAESGAGEGIVSEVDYVPDVVSYEFEFDDGVYEVDVPVLFDGDVKKRSLLGCLFAKNGKPIRDMEVVPQLERAFDDFDIEYEEVA